MKRFSLLLALVLVFASAGSVFAGELADGSYVGYSDASAKSYNYAKVFINGGEITGVVLREFTNKDVEKDWTTYPWENAATAAQTLGAQFIENQSAEADMVSGATGSSTGYIQAVERALAVASGDVEGKYFDGTFLGRSHASARGYYEIVWVTIEDDQIVDIDFERVLPDHSILDPADYNFPLEQARQQYKNEAIEGNTAQVDTISGATGSTGMWNVAVQDALDKASTGK